MNTRLADAEILAESVANGLEGIGGLTVVLCPPVSWLVPLALLLERRPPGLELGAQDLFYEDEGAYTGQVSFMQLQGIIQFAICGHSERRRHFGETSEVVRKKILSALRFSIRPIIALGEFQKPAERGTDPGHYSWPEIQGQIDFYFRHLTPDQVEKVVVAYEPVWAIGKERPVNPKYAAQIADKIRTEIEKHHRGASGKVPILYGGSLTAEAAKVFAKESSLQGFLVGRESLRSKEFLRICQLAKP